MRLAGCEEGVRLEAFAPFVTVGAYDVMMPDVKYVGVSRRCCA
jgi:galactonate dehydratase